MTQVQFRDASGQAVPSRLDPERRAPRDKNVNRIVIHQGLKLGCPGVEVLNLVQENVGSAARVGCLVERLCEDSVLEPATECQDRSLEPLEGRQLIELKTEETMRLDSLFEVLLNQLLLDGGLTDLSGPSEDHDGGKAGFELCPGRRERPAPERGEHSAGLSLPPRVGGTDKLGEGWREAL